MDEQAAEHATITYTDLIREVFIRPIRSVMVVDDEFPTLADFLEDAPVLDTRKIANKQRVRDILNVCRDPSRSWLVDVHDGSSTREDVAIASHLHHSDLMMLDYHLEHFSERGDKAIKILRELSKSSHFNLVIVYTAAGDGIGGDINRTVGEIALGLSCHDKRLDISSRGLEVIEGQLDEWSDAVPNIMDRLVEQVDPVTFIGIRWEDTLSFKEIINRIEFEGLRALVASASVHGIQIEPRHVLKWVLYKTQKNWAGDLSPDDLGKVTLGIAGNGVNWIRTNTLFVTVISKTRQPSELPLMLTSALVSWDPLPQRLILSKIRAELDSIGVLAEDEILSNRYLQSGWLDDFLRDTDERILGGVTVERHWESLGDIIRQKVVEYSHQLATSLPGLDVGFNRTFEGLTPLDFVGNQSLIRQHTNRYACSKRIDGSHLKVGHVFEIEHADSALRYWICLTPACDLVPGQKSSAGWAKRLGGWLPFKAVQLFPETAENALKDAERAYHLFLEVDGVLKTFGFSPSPSPLSNPKWEQMFSKDDGVFSDDDRHLTITVLTGDDVNGIATTQIKGRVVAQLRYEYALNLLQRLGANLSRIGLDFKSHNAQQ